MKDQLIQEMIADVVLFARRITAREDKLGVIDETGIATKENMWRSTIFGMRLELK
jgi:hypothetical protein